MIFSELVVRSDKICAISCSLISVELSSAGVNVYENRQAHLSNDYLLFFSVDLTKEKKRFFHGSQDLYVIKAVEIVPPTHKNLNVESLILVRPSF